MSYIFDGTNWDPADPTSITNLLLEHIYLTVAAVLIGLLIAFPIALLVARYRRLDTPITTTASVIYTIPSLALMPLLIPFTGLAVPTILIPLVAYTQVVLIRNIVAAIQGVDPALIDVGRGMGMNSRQLQTRVVLPLALPIIVAGIRVVTVTTIGIATLAPLIGVEDLGFLIFQGFNLHRYDMLVAGAVLVSVLAIAVDLALLGVQRLLSHGNAVSLAQ